MNIKDLIAEVREHHRRATPGPWLHYKRAHPSPAWAVTDVEDENAQQITAEGEPNDIALIAHYRTAAPILADEVERLTAENATLRDNLKHIEHALGDRIEPGQTPERAIADLIADMDRMAVRLEEARKEADDMAAAGRAVVEATDEMRRQWAEIEDRIDEEKRTLADALEEARLTLAAEQGREEGAPAGWRRVGRDSFEKHADGARVAVVWRFPEGGRWEWWVCGRSTGQELTARAAMLAADKDTP